MFFGGDLNAHAASPLNVRHQPKQGTCLLNRVEIASDQSKAHFMDILDNSPRSQFDISIEFDLNFMMSLHNPCGTFANVKMCFPRAIVSLPVWTLGL